jgi:hypothetical protein
MRVLAILFAIFGVLFAEARSAGAATIDIDLTTQTMHVRSARGASYVWRISSARADFVTPRGSYRPQSLQRMHYSKKYHNSPMPYSIFFRGGYAIHGTYETASLGRPVSHGCVRLLPAHAAKLFAMVKREGATIHISGSPPIGRTIVARGQGKSRAHFARTRAPHKTHRTSRAGKRTHAHPLAYAPAYRGPGLKVWLYDPAPRY